MTTMTAEYLGDLRVEAVHTASGAKIITDAPVDNHGKGEGFSPTDLCALSLANCSLTIMGIYAQTHGADITGTTMDVEKIMSANPRRIGEIKITFNFPKRDYTDRQKQSLEHCAHTCPVHLTLHPEVLRTLVFNWG